MVRGEEEEEEEGEEEEEEEAINPLQKATSRVVQNHHTPRLLKAHQLTKLQMGFTNTLTKPMQSLIRTNISKMERHINHFTFTIKRQIIITQRAITQILIYKSTTMGTVTISILTLMGTMSTPCTKQEARAKSKNPAM